MTSEYLHVECKSMRIHELLRAHFENGKFGIALDVSTFLWKIQFVSVLYLSWLYSIRCKLKSCTEEQSSLLLKKVD